VLCGQEALVDANAGQDPTVDRPAVLTEEQMKRLENAVPVLVTFGPITMMVGTQSDVLGHVISIVGALMLGAGAAVMFSMLATQSKEIASLHAELERVAGRRAS
jgi:hypothetical protein